MNSTAYTSANSLPLKVIKYLDNRRINPIHLQVIPTNRCNLNCVYCSCKAVDRSLELSKQELFEINHMANKVGIKAYTITGGGEPLVHPHINEFIIHAKSLGIKIGLTTNGKSIKNLSKQALGCITWCRISLDDKRHITDDIKEVIEDNTNVDWSFSYVAYNNTPDYDNIINIIEYINLNRLTHFRLVPDLFNLDNINMDALKAYISEFVDTTKCIFQERQAYTKGNSKCAISLLKPLVNADGYIYPCCGCQYALDKDTYRTMPEEMRMCHYTEFPKLVGSQLMYNGSKCKKCYYESYNTLLNAREGNFKHQEWV